MWSSRRTSLARPADTVGPRGWRPFGARLAAAAVLIVAGALALALAAYLLALVLGWDAVRVGDEVASWSHWLRALLLGVFFGALGLLTWAAASRRGERWLRLGADHGAVFVSLAALQRLAAATALRDPDVIGAEARLRDQDGAPAGRLRLQVRPLVDAAPLAEHVGAEARVALDAVIGREATRLDVATTVLTVQQLKDRLP